MAWSLAIRMLPRMPPPGKRESYLRAAPVLAIGALLFTAASLLPWRHLVSSEYLARFAGFAGTVTAAAGVLGWIFFRLGPRSARSSAAMASAVVFVAVWTWNRRGPIDVVLLHLDSLRAANTSLHGYDRDTTPRIAELVEEGAVQFTQFIAQSAGTDKSTPAMLASIYPSMFYDPWTDGTNFLVPDRFPMAGQFLRDRGYASVGISSNPEISAIRNYSRGFDEWLEVWKGGPRPAALSDLIFERMEGTASPLFCFGLILDPHLPYTPAEGFDVFSGPDALPAREIVERVRGGESPEPYVGMTVDRYDGEILEVDAAVGALVADLKAAGRWERTMLIVTSDHGEKFLEHGELGHGGTLYDEVLDIPLVWTFPSPLRYPPLEPKHRSYAGLASHVDLLPTILGFLGHEAPGDTVQGTDLTPWLYREDAPLVQEVLSEELIDHFAHRSLRGERWQAMTLARETENRVEMLVDRQEGSAPTVSASELERLRTDMLERLDHKVAALVLHYRKKDEQALEDPETLERLQDLGYTR